MAEIRICCTCGKPMSSGFCIGDGALYYCSAKCLEEVYTTEEYNQMYDAGEAYWTEWESVFEDETPATIKVCHKEPGRPVQIREINNTLGALQHLVGGYIELARVFKKGIAILCDEEGLIKDKRPNCMGLVGPIVFIGLNGSDFRSLTDDEILAIEEWEAMRNAV